MTLDNDTRKELMEYAVGLIQEHVYNDMMSNISLVNYDNRYLNWYKGTTRIELPYWGQNSDPSCTDSQCREEKLRYDLHTYETAAGSNSISTKSFGDKFKGQKIERNIKYSFYVFPPFIRNKK